MISSQSQHMDFIFSFYYNNCQSKKHFRQFFFFITPSYFNICGMLRKGIPLLFYDKMENKLQKATSQLSAFFNIR